MNAENRIKTLGRILLMLGLVAILAGCLLESFDIRKIWVEVRTDFGSAKVNEPFKVFVVVHNDHQVWDDYIDKTVISVGEKRYEIKDRRFVEGGRTTTYEFSDIKISAPGEYELKGFAITSRGGPTGVAITKITVYATEITA